MKHWTEKDLEELNCMFTEDETCNCETCSENNNAEWDKSTCPLREAGLCMCED